MKNPSWAPRGDEASAAQVAALLTELYRFTPADPMHPGAGLASDGEPMWLEQRGTKVVVVKSVAAAAAPIFADAAFAAATPAAPRPRSRLPAAL
jgi:hypothetical protein